MSKIYTRPKALFIKDLGSIAVISVQEGHFIEMTDVRILLSKNMKHFREISGFSQMELAEKIGCSPTLIGKIETMKRFPSADSLNRIAKALEVKVSDLFAEQEPESMKAMVSKRKLKSKLERIMGKAVDEFFRQGF